MRSSVPCCGLKQLNGGEQAREFNISAAIGNNMFVYYFHADDYGNNSNGEYNVVIPDGFYTVQRFVETYNNVILENGLYWVKNNNNNDKKLQAFLGFNAETEKITFHFVSNNNLTNDGYQLIGYDKTSNILLSFTLNSNNNYVRNIFGVTHNETYVNKNGYSDILLSGTNNATITFDADIKSILPTS